MIYHITRQQKYRIYIYILGYIEYYIGKLFVAYRKTFVSLMLQSEHFDYRLIELSISNGRFLKICRRSCCDLGKIALNGYPLALEF